MQDPQSVLGYWLDEVGPPGWYRSDPKVDATIHDRFAPLVEAARAERLEWTTTPRGTLALLVLLDQFPRNMFRGQADAFASDPLARATAKRSIDQGCDMRIEPPARQFFYLPLMHSECLGDQERSVRLTKERLPGLDETLLHARAHREVIRRFGRFPHRNQDLARKSTTAEAAFLDGGGYGAVVNALKEPA